MERYLIVVRTCIFSLKKKPQWSSGRFPTSSSEDFSILINCVPQIRNIVYTAHALATQEKAQVAMLHLEIAIAVSTDVESDFRGAGEIDSGSYTQLCYYWLGLIFLNTC